MVDRYTKAVLTVIAICLVVIAMRGSTVEKAVAQSGPVRVIQSGPVHVIVDQVASYALRFAGPLQVRQ